MTAQNIDNHSFSTGQDAINTTATTSMNQMPTSTTTTTTEILAWRGETQPNTTPTETIEEETSHITETPNSNSTDEMWPRRTRRTTTTDTDGTTATETEETWMEPMEDTSTDDTTNTMGTPQPFMLPPD